MTSNPRQKKSAAKSLASVEGKVIAASSPAIGKDAGKEIPAENAPGWEGWLVPGLGNAAEAHERKARAAPQRPEAPSGDAAAVEKARAELMTAVSRKNFTALSALMERGIDPNFIINKYGSWQSPLGFAVMSDWLDGVLALTRAGAVESVARERHKSEDQASAAERRDREYKMSRWKHIRSWQIFESLIRSEEDAEQLEYVVQSATHDPRKALVLLIEGKHGLLAGAQWSALERVALTDLSTRQVAEGNVSLVLLDHLWNTMPERLAASSDIRWEVAIRSDKPRLIATLAKNGSPAPKNWSGYARSADFPDIARLGGIAQLTRMTKASAEGAALESGEKETKKIRAPLWTLAALRGATEALSVLGEIPAIREAALADPRTPVFMAFVGRAEVLKELARQGLDLQSCVSANHETPMHTACAGYNPSKTHLMDMARLCPDWLTVKNSRGLTPLELLVKTADGRLHSSKTMKIVADIERATLKKDLREAKATASIEKKAAKARGESAPTVPAAKKPVSRRL